MEKVKVLVLALLGIILITIIALQVCPNQSQEEVEYDLDMEFQVVRGEIQQLKAENEALAEKAKMSVADSDLREWIKE